jgi:hypothetical protein
LPLLVGLRGRGEKTKSCFDGYRVSDFFVVLWWVPCEWFFVVLWWVPCEWETREREWVRNCVLL